MSVCYTFEDGVREFSSFIALLGPSFGLLPLIFSYSPVASVGVQKDRSVKYIILARSALLEIADLCMTIFSA